jgi:hypothetical protein
VLVVVYVRRRKEKKIKFLETKMIGGGGGGDQAGPGQELRAADPAATKREFVVNVESSCSVSHNSDSHLLPPRNSAFFIPPPPPPTTTTTQPKVLYFELLHSLCFLSVSTHHSWPKRIHGIGEYILC